MPNIALITNNILSDSGVPITSNTSGTSGTSGAGTISGTTGTITKFTGTTTVGNSIMTESANIVTLAGYLNVTALGNNGVSTGLISRDITAARSSNTGVVYLGSDGNHYVYFDGSNYQMPSGGLTVGGVITATSFTGGGTIVYSNTSTTVNGGNGQFTPIPANTLTAGVPYIISFQITAGGRTISGVFPWRVLTGTAQAYSVGNSTQIGLSEGGNYAGASYFGDTNGAVIIQTSGMDLNNAPSWSVEVRKV